MNVRIVLICILLVATWPAPAAAQNSTGNAEVDEEIVAQVQSLDDLAAQYFSAEEYELALALYHEFITSGRRSRSHLQDLPVAARH